MLGSIVWYEFVHPLKKGLHKKFKERYTGPYIIVRLTSDQTYWLINARRMSGPLSVRRSDAKKLKLFKGNTPIRYNKIISLINSKFYEKYTNIRDIPIH